MLGILEVINYYLISSADPNGILMSFETYAHAQDLVKVAGINKNEGY